MASDSIHEDADAYPSGGWFRCESSWWRHTAELLLAAGEPWPRAVAMIDLRWWANEVAAGRRSRLPSRRALCRRWGWGDRRVRSLLKDGSAWRDPYADRPSTAPPAPQHRPSAAPPAPREEGESGDLRTEPPQHRPSTAPPAPQHSPIKVHTRAVQQEQEQEQEAEEYVQGKPAPSPESDTQTLWPGVEDPPPQPSEAARRGAGTRKAEEAFEAWWASVPRKKAKRAAKARAWPAALKRLGWTGYDDKTLSQAVWVIAQGTDRWRREAAEAESPKYICMPATWLNQDRWEDEEAAQASHDDAPSWQAGRERSRTQLADKLRADVAALEERERDEGLPEGLASALEAKRRRLEALEGVA